MPPKKTPEPKAPTPQAQSDRTLWWAVAFLAAAVFFGGGYLVGQAVGDDGDGHHGPHGLDSGMMVMGHHDGQHLPGMYPSHPGDFSDDRAGGGFLGIAGIDGPMAVRVVAVVPGGPADEAGVQVGDRVIAYDGTEISSMEQLADLVAATHPGTEVEMILGGPGGGRSVTVVIGERM